MSVMVAAGVTRPLATGARCDGEQEIEMMKDTGEIRAKREQAYGEAGWGTDGSREWPDLGDEAAESDRLRDRSYAEGVEAALLWVMNEAGDPFPR